MKNAVTFLTFLLLSTFLICCQLSVKDRTETFTDNRDGKVYKIIKIGDQTWFAENLAYKTKDGCWAPDGENSNIKKYGYLYYWETVKIACPAGWHVPSDSEWTTLIDTLAAENRLVEMGTIKYSNSLNAIIINKSSYGGMFLGVGFSGMDELGWWWSSTQDSSTYAFTRVFHRDKKNFEKTKIPTIGYAVNVRCVKD